ncbi:sensor histidine kinase [Sphingomonas pituitosa]|uniref:sensor histidine kinase n=1 Tax=Sphingomonas pituitosa TaxID=99597 RepID=UPI00082E94AD|nr:triple tyrosine motif-containing protein [Sphingomonas pituitosa]
MSIGSASAQEPPPGFAGFKHVRWGADEGAPNGVFKMAQTPDGYLWLTSDGLHRFDGVTFERIDWPAGAAKKRLDPVGLMVSRAGELWVGLNGAAGVAVYRNGQLVDVGMPDPPAAIGAMTEGADGTMWFASSRFDGQLRRLRAGRWESVGATLAMPPGAVMGVATTRDGTLWIALTHADGKSGSVAYLKPGANRFHLLPDQIASLPRIGVDPSGALWLSDRRGARILVDRDGNRPERAAVLPISGNVRTAQLVFDRAGGLWRTSETDGLSYVPQPSRPAPSPAFAFTAADGLSADITHATLVDREGSVWFATDAGIDQFRRASATQEEMVPPDPLHGLSIAQANDGSVYIHARATLYRVAPGGLPQRIAKTSEGDTAICTARQGGVWVVQQAQTLHADGERLERTRPYPGPMPPMNCAEDGRRRLWVGLLGQPLRWRDAAGWHVAGGILGQQRVWDLVATRGGDIAFTTKGGLGTLQGDRLSLHAKSGSSTMLAAGLTDLFLSDDRGLVRLRAGRLERLSETRFPWLAWLRGLVQTDRGETWLIARTGISRLATADLDQAFRAPGAPLPRRLFDTRDGLISPAQHSGFSGLQAALGGDGRVWFLNRQGAAYFAPVALASNPLAPPVVIRSLASGTLRWRDPADLVLPAGTRALDIRYAGLSFIVPQRVRFRYRLDGVDADWVDAGARRMASYTNLEPGRYRFRVVAANADGVWNRTGAALDFEIRPTFWQSTPFKLLCAAALLGLLWGGYVLRLRAVAARIRLRMTDRFEERERIARELHDTLLQGIQSVTLRFQRVVNELPAQQPARGSLLQALDVADQVIAEGRDRVQDLRSRQHDALEPLLRDLVAQQWFEPGVEVTVSESGRRRRIEPLALDEIVRIAGEALANVRRHAGATRVGVEIGYGRRLRLRIIDDGVGIDPVVAETGKAGHFGLRGMRERARKLRGTLALRPLPDHGSELVLTVPGRVAYLPGRRRWWARIRRVR